MRRATPGVLGRSELLPTRIARAERHDPEEVIARLEPFVLERRRERMRAVIAARLDSVRVCFDAPHDPHNGAAVIRSCEAFGVQAVHVVERKERFLAAGSVTRGAERWVDLHGHPTPESAIAQMREGGYTLVAAVADGELLPGDLASIPRVAIVLGNEREGVGEELLAACAKRVRVPMRGFVESLNVSVTCAILLARATEGRPGDLPETDQRRLYARGLYFSVDHAEEILKNA
jgi:tRNA (guanosine-2'-O-)-methyltransferase